VTINTLTEQLAWLPVYSQGIVSASSVTGYKDSLYIAVTSL